MGRGLLGYGISVLGPYSLKVGALAMVLGCGLTLSTKKWWLVGQIAFWGVTYGMGYGGCFLGVLSSPKTNPGITTISPLPRSVLYIYPLWGLYNIITLRKRGILAKSESIGSWRSAENKGFQQESQESARKFFIQILGFVSSQNLLKHK